MFTSWIRAACLQWGKYKKLFYMGGGGKYYNCASHIMKLGKRN